MSSQDLAKSEVQAEPEKKQRSFIGPDDELPDVETFETYDGNCHCGTFGFKITLPEITKLNECNCSICFMNGLRGLVWFPVKGLRKFEIVEGDEEKDLTSYSFGRTWLQHKFCKECGTNVFARQGDYVGINALALEPMPEIEVIPYASRSDMQGAEYRPPHYAPQHGEPLKWTKDDKPLEEGHVEYQGHCHCGSVRYVLRWKPMQEWDKVTDCNCSYCFKGGIQNIYPPASAVQYSANVPEETTEYTLIYTDNAAVFCKTCGTHVFVKLRPEVPIAAINVRTLEDPEAKGEMLNHKKVRGRCNVVKTDMRSQPPFYEGRRHKIVEGTRIRL